MAIPRQLPNAITIVRILCAPIFVWMLLADAGADGALRWGAAVLFIVAIATDGIDGYLARRLNQVSELGKALDPIADRLALVVGIGAILWVGAAPVWVAVLALGREVVVSVAVVVLGILVARGETTFLDNGTGHTTLLVLAGVVTAVPLLLFAAAARRLPLVTVGLIQFVTPVLQLLVGVLVLGEHVSARLWVGFGIVWLALVVLTIDSVRTASSSRTERRRIARLDGPDGTAAPEPCP